MLVLARLAALRASTPRFIIRILAIVHHVTFTVVGQMLATVNNLRNRSFLTLRDHIIPATRALAARAAQTSVARAGRTAAIRAAGAPPVHATGAAMARAARATARRVAGLPAVRAAAAAAARAATVIAGRSARMARALPARARIPAAAAGVLTFAVVAALAAAGVGAPGASMAAARSQAALTHAAAPAAQRPAASAAAPVHKVHTVTRHAARQASVTHAAARPAAARHATARHAPARPAGKQHASVAVKHARPARHVRHVLDLSTWHAITEAAAGHRHGGGLAPQEKLLPAGLYGSQAAMAITPARAANAEVITHEALRLHMGIRSAVIAVATAMQESTLENLVYGDRDSLGLFQQRPSAGWGSPAQITNRVYAADAFLHALATYQHDDPAWASQPLWEAAQGVQRSAFPYAYAQWEDQAAHIVAVATRHLL